MDSSLNLWPHTGAILAGGLSARMGAPKHGLRLPDGRTMIERVAEALGAVCSRVVVLAAMEPGGDEGSFPLGLTIIRDARPACGPLGAIEALLASGHDSQYLVCPCDVPAIGGGILRSLVRPSGATITAMRIEGDAQSLPIRVGADALPTVRAHLDRGERAIHRLLAAATVEWIDGPIEWREMLANVNTREEFERLTGWHGRRLP